MALEIDATPQTVLDCRNNLGESVLWDDRAECLRWVSIHAGEIWSWRPQACEQPKVRCLAERVGAIGLRDENGLVVALSSGFALLESEDADLVPLATVDANLPATRLNDGRVDPAGRFVCGGMHEGTPQQHLSSVYSLASAEEEPRRLIADVACANSICWSPDGGTLYFTDMPTRRIDAFDYDVATGTVANRRLFADLADEPGFADDSTVDEDGFLWNAQWGASKIVRYAPDGLVDREVALPVTNPTCIAFGGPDLDILFVTTAWFGLSDAQRAAEPEAGHLFAFRPGVRGRPEHRFRG